MQMHTDTHSCVCSPLPRWTGSASHMHCVCTTVLKGGFHNGPWWAWDDGYGLSLGVNAAGPGPLQVYNVTSFAICHHCVGINPWPGLGQRTPGPPTTHTPLYGRSQESSPSAYPTIQPVSAPITWFLLSHMQPSDNPLRFLCFFGSSGYFYKGQ